MSDHDRLSIGADVVEAALRTFLSLEHLSEQEKADWMVDMGTAIREALDKLELRVDDDDGHNECYRLISKWMSKGSDWRQVDAEPRGVVDHLLDEGPLTSIPPSPSASVRVDTEPSEPEARDLRKKAAYFLGVLADAVDRHQGYEVIASSEGRRLAALLWPSATSEGER